MNKRQTADIHCSRCGDKLHLVARPPEQESGVLNLDPGERIFITSRSPGPLCLPCRNQLKSSYRIRTGFFN